jgi:hypothetical protein
LPNPTFLAAVNASKQYSGQSRNPAFALSGQQHCRLTNSMETVIVAPLGAGISVSGGIWEIAFCHAVRVGPR